MRYSIDEKTGKQMIPKGAEAPEEPKTLEEHEAERAKDAAPLRSEDLEPKKEKPKEDKKKK